jgi:hypothetical protein
VWYFCLIVTKLEYSRRNFNKSRNVQFHVYSSFRNRVVRCEQVNGRVDKHTKLTLVLRSFAKSRKDSVALKDVAFVHFEYTVKCCGKKTNDIKTWALSVWIKQIFPLFLSWPFRKLKFLSPNVIRKGTLLLQAVIDWHIFLKLWFHMTEKNEITHNRKKPNLIIRKYNLLLHMVRPKSTRWPRRLGHRAAVAAMDARRLDWNYASVTASDTEFAACNDHRLIALIQQFPKASRTPLKQESRTMRHNTWNN